MFLFALKKSFFDAWDNMGTLAISNYGLLALLLIAFWLPSLTFTLMGLLIIPLLVVGNNVVSGIMTHVADGYRAQWKDVPGTLKSSWKGSLIFGLAVMFFAFITVTGVGYYSSMDTLIGATAGAFMFWIALGAWLSGMWFPVLQCRIPDGTFKSFRKSGFVMLDNPGLSFFAGLVVSPVQLLLWPLTAFGGFGPAGIQLFYSVCLRLLLLKYNWLEEHPGAKKRDVPWDVLLAEERDKLGPRTLKNTIFPWKD